MSEHRLPPIQYLSAFVEAARYNSFKQAANELNVTPSAISQQIKNLEEHLGLSLFTRKARALDLTQEGMNFYRIAERTLRTYEEGYSEFVNRYFSATLTVSTTPYISNEILIPRLHEFHERYPQISLVVQASTRLEDLANTGLDAGIRIGVPSWEGYEVELISECRSGLVASPDYIERNPLKKKADWAKQTLIHTRSHVNDWQRVSTLANAKANPDKELIFDSYAAGIRAAEEGLGLAIGMFPLSNEKVRRGQLVVLSERYQNVDEGVYFVTKRNDKKQRYYAILFEWLKSVFANC